MMTGPKSRHPRHFFTVEVEEYFQTDDFGTTVDRAEWDCLPPRARLSTLQLADVIESLNFRGTFFVAGWVADREPELVEELAERGHEIASHGWSHRPIQELSRSEFQTEVRRSKKLLEDLSGRPVHGFRCHGDISPSTVRWVFELLAAEGYRYDSSLFDGDVTPDIGGRSGTRGPGHRLETSSGLILEFPVGRMKLGEISLPANGSVLFRHAPELYYRWVLSTLSQRDQGAVFRLRCWEVDRYQPMLPLPLLSRLRHYRGRDRVVPRLQQLRESVVLKSLETAVLRGDD